MAAKISRRLVVDASVARAAGDEEATNPRSIRCRDVLVAILTISHRVVMTPEILDEWHTHQSHFAAGWLTSMVARHKVIFVRDAPSYNELRSKIESAAFREKDRAAMRKDFHLLQAAMATDRTVMSLDQTVRALFAATAGTVGELKAIAWVHPDDPVIIRWLEEGARPAKEHLLGYQADGGT